MTLHLRKGLSWCLCSGRAVFLDIEADRYFCLASDLDSAFARWTEGEAMTAEALEVLLGRGLLTEDPGASGPPLHPGVPRPKHDLLESRCPRVRIADIARALLAELWVALSLRRLGLAGVLRRFEGRGARDELPTGRLQSRARRIAAAFAANGLILGAHDRCLGRALALMLACHRLGLFPTLVFGVRLNPFAAHCWVQWDEAVLVGDFEQVRLFTPILAVR